MKKKKKKKKKKVFCYKFPDFEERNSLTKIFFRNPVSNLNKTCKRIKLIIPTFPNLFWDFLFHKWVKF